MSASPYAWIIDRDHLNGPGGMFDGEGFDDCQGVCGPSHANIPDEVIDRDDYSELKAVLAANYEHHHQFRMYDDDGECYVTGTLYWNGYSEQPWDDSDDFNYGPLRDYGAGGMGCVEVRYTGRKDWDCG